MDGMGDVGVLLNNDFRWKELCESHASSNACQLAAALASLLTEYSAKANRQEILSKIKEHYDENFHACFDGQLKYMSDGNATAMETSFDDGNQHMNRINGRERSRSEGK